MLSDMLVCANGLPYMRVCIPTKCVMYSCIDPYTGCGCVRHNYRKNEFDYGDWGYGSFRFTAFNADDGLIDVYYISLDAILLMNYLVMDYLNYACY